MRFVLLAIMALFFSLFPLAQAATPPLTRQATAGEVSANHLYHACEKYFDHTFNTRENISRKATCNGYFFGVASTLLLLQEAGAKIPFCLPATLSTEDTARIFLKWGKSSLSLNPDEFATQAVMKSLEQAYPCKTID